MKQLLIFCTNFYYLFRQYLYIKWKRIQVFFHSDIIKKMLRCFYVQNFAQVFEGGGEGGKVSVCQYIKLPLQTNK